MGESSKSTIDNVSFTAASPDQRSITQGVLTPPFRMFGVRTVGCWLLCPLILQHLDGAGKVATVPPGTPRAVAPPRRCAARAPPLCTRHGSATDLPDRRGGERRRARRSSDGGAAGASAGA